MNLYKIEKREIIEENSCECCWDYEMDEYKLYMNWEEIYNSNDRIDCLEQIINREWINLEEI